MSKDAELRRPHVPPLWQRERRRASLLSAASNPASCAESDDEEDEGEAKYAEPLSSLFGTGEQFE